MGTCTPRTATATPDASAIPSLPAFTISWTMDKTSWPSASTSCHPPPVAVAGPSAHYTWTSRASASLRSFSPPATEQQQQQQQQFTMLMVGCLEKEWGWGGARSGRDDKTSVRVC